MRCHASLDSYILGDLTLRFLFWDSLDQLLQDFYFETLSHFWPPLYLFISSVISSSIPICWKRNFVVFFLAFKFIKIIVTSPNAPLGSRSLYQHLGSTSHGTPVLNHDTTCNFLHNLSNTKLQPLILFIED